jgi:hypothetical protein
MFDLKKMASNMGRLLSDMSNQNCDVKYKLYLTNKTIKLLQDELLDKQGYKSSDASTIAELGHKNEALSRKLLAKEAEINGLHMIIESHVLNK